MELAMAGTEIDRLLRRVTAAARKDDALITRAVQRAKLARTALASAAGDVARAHSADGNALAGLAEIILDESERLSRLVEDIESHRPGKPQHQRTSRRAADACGLDIAR